MIKNSGSSTKNRNTGTWQQDLRSVVFIYSLFNDAVSSSGYTALYGRMIGK
jgi:hypothetical protein